jgi:protein ImuB
MPSTVPSARAARAAQPPRAPRTLALWCPDWPIVAAGSPPDEPAVVVYANRVVAVSAAARAEGVRRGQRRREAQSRAPDVVVHSYDPARDARAFEPVAAAVEDLGPAVEILRPGLLVAPAAGATRYYGGEEAVLACVAGAAREALAKQPSLPPRAGIADGSFAAVQAAFASRLVPAGTSRAFLAPLPVSALGDPDLASLLVRLGVSTIGAFAALPPNDVLARFGPDGARLHRKARVAGERPPLGREQQAELCVEQVLDPPVERVEAATFAAKALAEDLAALLAGQGLACTGLRIEAQTEHGEGLSRVWRHDDGFNVSAVAERARWQLDGWLSGTVGAGADAPTAGVSLLRLVPIAVRDAGRQLALWGEEGRAGAERAGQAIDRIQGLLGPEAVVTAVLGGGRDVAERVRLVPWGEPRGEDATDLLPWPGRLPQPAPAEVLDAPEPVTVTTAEGEPVGVTGRFAVTGEPARLVREGQSAVDLIGWAGPWPADIRWWDATSAARRARFQVVTADQRGLLLAVAGGQWWLEAAYA